MATHSSIPTWRIPWTEELGRLQSMGSQKRQTLLKQLSTHALVCRNIPFVYFCFYFQYSGRWVIEDPAVVYVGECFACFPLGVLQFLVLCLDL